MKPKIDAKTKSVPNEENDQKKFEPRMKYKRISSTSSKNFKAKNKYILLVHNKSR